jgi:hypothetical protein
MTSKRIIAVESLLLILGACGSRPIQRDPNAVTAEWPTYGNDPGSSRHSGLTEITPDNVSRLEVAWTYHTGDIANANSTWNGQKVWAKSTFEATPLVVEDTLYVATPFNRIIALDPETGRERWTFDPQTDRIAYYGDFFTCRGLATWVDPDRRAGEACRRMLYTATQDGRLIAVDAAAGKPCPAFGDRGEVSLKQDIENIRVKGEYHFTSAPAVVGAVVIVGSAINDNDRVEMPPGVVRGYDARTGALLWTWDPVPRDPNDPARACALPPRIGFCWPFLAYVSGARQGQLVELRSVPVRIGRAEDLLGARRDGPIHPSHYRVRRPLWCRPWSGTVPHVLPLLAGISCPNISVRTTTRCTDSIDGKQICGCSM